MMGACWMWLLSRGAMSEVGVGMIGYRLKLERLRALVEMIEDVVGSGQVVEVVEDGGVVKVVLQSGRVIEVPASRILQFLVDVVTMVIRVVAKEVVNYLERKLPEMAKELRMEMDEKKVMVTINGVEVEVKEAIAVAKEVLRLRI